MILEKMKLAAERFTGQEVRKCVVTVPAYFNDVEKQATKDACAIAGLECIRVITEPTAAALAYGLRFRSNTLKKCLVFDLGGGTFDVTVLTIQGDDIKVLAHAGDPHLGGQDFDNVIMNRCIEEFE